MNPQGHRRRAEALLEALKRIEPGAPVAAAIVEIAHGIALHLSAAVLLERHHIHHDEHRGIAKVLERQGHSEQAKAFRRLEVLRLSHWYGGHANGEVMRECRELVGMFQRFADAG